MCLAAIAVLQHPRFPWVVAANRDEFFARPTAPLAWWQPAPGEPALLSGRDMAAGGTWLGVNTQGRFAMVTNVREPQRAPLPSSPSRGELVTQWLRQHQADATLLHDALHTARNGFNLLVGQLGGETGLWLNNRLEQQRAFGPGMFGLSNAALDTDWPKLSRLKQRLRVALQAAPDAAQLVDQAFAALADTTPAADAELPDTGVGLARERALSPAFIRLVSAEDAGAAHYGTRCSTVVVVEQVGHQRVVRVFERSFASDGAVSGETAQTLTLARP
jgi:uncharacterized protein with NRDE domain